MNATWFDRIAELAGGSPSRVAIEDGDERIDYAELVARAEHLAGWLYENGLRAGDRVGIHLRKGVEEVALTLGAMRLGAVFVNIHPQLTTRMVEHVVLDSGLALLVTHERRARELSKLRLPARVCSVESREGTKEHPPWPAPASEQPYEPPPVAAPGGDTLAALLYTSASTGRAKGVMHSHANLLSFARNVAQYLGLTAEDRVLGLLPLSFGYGLNQLLSTLYAGGALVLQKAPFPAEVVQALRERAITGLAAVPSVWEQLLALLDARPTQLPRLRFITNAGGHLRAASARRLHHHLPQAEVYLMYGSTEALRSTYLDPRRFPEKNGSIGTAIPNVSVLVLSPEGRPCGVGEPGELVHSGSHVSQGYWNNPEETARRFRAASGLPGVREGERVYFSGDLVKQDEDGVLWFVSRESWMVKSGGFRFSLTEVEESLGHSQLVEQAAAVAVEDAALGQVVHAVVASSGEGSAPDCEALQRYCWRAMPSYMIPKAFHVWPGKLPLLANGKLDRKVLEQHVAALQPG